jgi:hypothetical protein
VTTLAAAPRAKGGYLPAVTSGVDRTIRVSAAVAVLAVAGIAAYVSCWHAYAVVRAHGGSGVTAREEVKLRQRLIPAAGRDRRALQEITV